MFQVQPVLAIRVPAPAGLIFSESKLPSGKRTAAGLRALCGTNDKNEARQRVHASAFSEPFRRVPGRILGPVNAFRSS